MNHVTRKPRFLAAVPEKPSPEPPRFAALPGTVVSARSIAPTVAEAEPPSPAPPAPDAAAVRQEAMERIGAAVATLRAQAERLAEQARSDAIEIGFQVARKVLETELHQNPEPLFALVRSALRRAGGSRRIAVRIAPADAAIVQSEGGRASVGGLASATIEYVVDPELQPGDCIVDAEFGQVDGRLSTRLSEIRRAADAAVEGAA